MEFKHVRYPPPPCSNGKCETCGHTHCGICWCEDGSERSGGDWSVVCAGVNKCKDVACDFCAFLMSYSPQYAPGSTRVCCSCLRGHPKVAQPDPSLPPPMKRYLPDANDRASLAYFIQNHNQEPERRRDFELNKKCQSSKGCTNWGSKTSPNGERLCNACFQSLGS